MIYSFSSNNPIYFTINHTMPDSVHYTIKKVNHIYCDVEPEQTEVLHLVDGTIVYDYHYSYANGDTTLIYEGDVYVGNGFQLETVNGSYYAVNVDVHTIIKDYLDNTANIDDAYKHCMGDETYNLSRRDVVMGDDDYVFQNDFTTYFLIEWYDGVMNREYLFSCTYNYADQYANINKNYLCSEPNIETGVINDYPSVEYINETPFYIAFRTDNFENNITPSEEGHDITYDRLRVKVWLSGEPNGYIVSVKEDVYTTLTDYVLFTSWEFGNVLKLDTVTDINKVFNISSLPPRPENSKVLKFQFMMLDTMYNPVPISPVFNVNYCTPKNSYVLYYFNLKGGFDFVPCTLKSKHTINAERNRIQHAPGVINSNNINVINAYSDTYLTNTTTEYVLNTEIMSDENSKKMKDIFLSKAIILYDVDEQKFKPVIINDSSLTIKKYDNDKIFNYTITVNDAITTTLY